MITVNNGKEALHVWAQHRQDIKLIISDTIMPEMGGIALFHALRQKDSSIKFILLTGHPLGEDLSNLRAHGLTDWIHKPPNLNRLALVIGQALGKV